MIITKEKIIKKKDMDNKHYATGKRKTSVAKVWLHTQGSGNFIVNGKNISKYFTSIRHIEEIITPLKILDLHKKYNIICNVKGSGITGQSGAIRLGISRALCKIDKKYHSILRKEGLITRDSRIVERKKYGQPKARKKFQFSKR